MGQGEDFRIRSVTVAAFAPATLFGLAEGSMMPVIALSAYDRGASTAIAALVGSLLGIGSIVTNIPSGMLATRIGERKSMIVGAVVTVIGLCLCLVNLGRGASLMEHHKVIAILARHVEIVENGDHRAVVLE